MLLDHYLLSLLIWIPILGGVLILLSDGELYPTRARIIALVISLTTLGLAGILVARFSTETSAMQFQEWTPWIPAYGIHYSLGVDGISMPMIVLTCFTTLLVVLAGMENDYISCCAIHGNIFTDARHDDWCFCCTRFYFVLYFLGRDVNSHVFKYWYLGR